MTLLEHSPSHERTWPLFHTDSGPHLLCSWYRPPCHGGTDSIAPLQAELEEHRRHGIRTIVMIDANVHNARWLKHSGGSSVEGIELRNKCYDLNLVQRATTPTRGNHPLDFVLTDIPSLKTFVELAIAHHRIVVARSEVSTPSKAVGERAVLD